MKSPLFVIAPQIEWLSAFAKEAARVSQALADIEHQVHHIGSTSIDGAYAKPVVDMLLTVASLEELDYRSHRLETAGYEAKGEYGIPQRRYFRLHSALGTRTHHVHGFVRGSEGAVRHLAFRDYMNHHPETARAYSDLKRELAGRYPNDSASYIAGKNDFVKKHELLALAWRGAAHGA